MENNKILFEHRDYQGNHIVCHLQNNGDKLHVLNLPDIKIEHTIANGKMSVFVNDKKKFGEMEYAEFYFFPIRDSHATLLVHEGSTVREVPYHVMIKEGAFMGFDSETLDKKIYLSLEILRQF